jgi:hypothetical protein
MVTTGLMMLVLGLLLGIPVLTTVGAVIAVIGAFFILFTSASRSVGRRPHLW